jgi:hypothetical protein
MYILKIEKKNKKKIGRKKLAENKVGRNKFFAEN